MYIWERISFLLSFHFTSNKTPNNRIWNLLPLLVCHLHCFKQEISCPPNRSVIMRDVSLLPTQVAFKILSFSLLSTVCTGAVIHRFLVLQYQFSHPFSPTLMTMNRSSPGLPVHHRLQSLPKLMSHRAGDAI